MTTTPPTPAGGHQSSDIARTNKMSIVQALRNGEAVSRVEIARLTGMAPATVNRLTTGLLAGGLLKEAGRDDNTGGRPSMTVRFDADARTLLAADIDQDRLEVAELNLDGQIQRRRAVDVKGLSSEAQLDALYSTIGQWVEARPADDPYVAVGVSVPGPVDLDCSVAVAPALGWYNVPVGAKLREVIDLPITVENDVNLIAYANYQLGDWGDISSLAAVGVFEGIGGGIVENGRLWRGHQGAAGQIGRMLRDVSGLEWETKGFGHLESRLGTGPLLRRAIEAGAVPLSTKSPDAVFEAASAGDEDALAFLQTISSEYALQLANLYAVVAPDVLVFSGLLGKWADLMLPMISDRLRGATLYDPRLAPSSFGDDAKLIGAGLLALAELGGVEVLV